MTVNRMKPRNGNPLTQTVNDMKNINVGHVYLIAPDKPRKGWVKGKGVIPIKIGVSKSINGVYNRLRDLSVGNWINMDIAYISPEIFQPYNVELYLHECYSKKKIRSEWFNLSYAEYLHIRDLLNREPDEQDPMRDYGEHIKEWGWCYAW